MQITVYHATAPRFSAEQAKPFPEGYEKVATIARDFPTAEVVNFRFGPVTP